MLTRLMNSTRSASALAVFLLALTVAGCSVQTEKPDIPASEAVVLESDESRTVEPLEAERLKLIARHRAALRQYQQGEREEAVAALREIGREAETLGVTLPEDVQATLRRAAEGEPLLLPETPAAAPQLWNDDLADLPSDALPSPPVEIVLNAERDEEDGRAEAFSGVVPPGVYAPLLDDPETAEKKISLDLNEVNIRLVFQMVSELTGINFLLDDNVQGTVTLISPTRIRTAEVYNVLESILDVKGFAAVPADRVVKIVPKGDAVRRNLATRIGADPRAMPLTDTIVTQIIPLRYAPVEDVNAIITPLVGRGAHMTTHANTNSLIVTDTSSNIHQIALIIEQVDVPGTQEVMARIPLKHASAETVARQVTNIMERPGAAPPTAPRPQPVERTERGPGEGFKLLPDPRTNSLIVVTNQKDMEVIRALVEELDVERPREASNIHVVYLENAEAEEVQKSLSAAVASLVSPDNGAIERIHITADQGTNSLIIIASPPDFRIISDMIEKLDVVREQVLVEMRIMEVSDDILRDIGIEWNSLAQASADSVRGFGMTDFGIRLESAAGDLEGMSLGAFKLVDGQTRIAAILKALEQHSEVNILSRPHVLTSNHNPARIVVGENIPFVRDSRVTEADPQAPTVIRTFDFKDVGVMLNITPHVSPTGLTRLNIESEFTQVIAGAPGVPAEIPTTSKREAKTIVTVADGATVVLGGLIRDDVTRTTRKVPVLGDIPYLGEFFKRTRTRTQKTNLLLFITPRVLATEADLAKATRDKAVESKIERMRMPLEDKARP